MSYAEYDYAIEQIKKLAVKDNQDILVIQTTQGGYYGYSPGHTVSHFDQWVGFKHIATVSLSGDVKEVKE